MPTITHITKVQAALDATDWMDKAVDEFDDETVQSLHSEEKAA